MKKKLPEIVYIYRDTTSSVSAEQFLCVHEEPDGIVELGESKILGVYRLQGFIEAKNQTTIGKMSPSPRHKRKS